MWNVWDRMPVVFEQTGGYQGMTFILSPLSPIPPPNEVFVEHPSPPTPSQVMEAFMSRKPPSSEDLRDLLPVVWWPGCRDEAGNECRMKVRGGGQGLVVVWWPGCRDEARQ